MTSKRHHIYLRELKSRISYWLISVSCTMIILLILKRSGMPDADVQLPPFTFVGYAVAAIVAHLAVDAACYFLIGFEMRRIESWRGILHFFATIAVMEAAFTYIDSFTPGGIVVLDTPISPASQMWAANVLLAFTVVAISTSFARGSARHQALVQVERECDAINQSIARRNAERQKGQGAIMMNQMVKIGSADGHPAEIDVGDLIYARRKTQHSIILAYSLGSKTCRVEVDTDEGLERLLDTFAPYQQVMRCHRDYIVNLDRVTRADSHGNRYQLHLRGTRRTVPVAGKYKNIVFEALTAEE